MSDLRDIAVKYAHLLSAPDYTELLNTCDRIEKLEGELKDELEENNIGRRVWLSGWVIKKQIDRIEELEELYSVVVAELKHESVENTRLREALVEIVRITPANGHNIWPHHHRYLCIARKALEDES